MAVPEPRPPPPARVDGVVDALDQLERRRRGTKDKRKTPKGNDLDLDTIR